MAEFLPPIVATLMANGDKFFATMDKASATLNSFHDKNVTLTQKLKTVGSLGATAITAGVAGAFIYGAKAAMELNNQMDVMQRQTGMSNDQMKALEGQVWKVAEKFGVGTDVIIPAYTKIVKVGLQGAQANDMMAQSMTLATLTMKGSVPTVEELAAATDQLISLQALHLKGVESTAQATQILWAAQSKANMTFEDLSGALGGRLVAVMSAFNISVQSTIPTLQFLANAGIKGQQAGQLLAMAYSRLETPAKRTDDIMKSLGLSQEKVATVALGPEGIVGAIALMREKFIAAGNPASQFGNLLLQVFGGRSAAGALLLSQNLEKVTGSIKNASTDTEAFKNAQQAYMEDPDTQWNKLKQTIKEGLTKFGNVIIPISLNAAHAVQDVVNYIKDNKALQTALEGLVAVAVAAKLRSMLLNALRGSPATVSQAANTGALDINTAAINRLTIAMGGSGVPVPGGPGGTPKPKPKPLGRVRQLATKVVQDAPKYIAPLAVDYLAARLLQSTTVDPLKKNLSNATNNVNALIPKTLPKGPTITAAQKLNGYTTVTNGNAVWVPGTGAHAQADPMLTMYAKNFNGFVTAAQEMAAATWVRAKGHNIVDGPGNAEFTAALRDFAARDLKHDYSLTVRIK